MQPPENLVVTGASPRFCANTVPAALLENHSTAAGVWGRLVVHVGDVSYHQGAASAAEPASAVRVVAGQSHWIPPEQRHYVALSADAEFEVEFYRVPDDQQREGEVRPCD